MKADPQHTVARALVAVDGMPSPSQLAMTSYPSEYHLERIANYWDDLSDCRAIVIRELPNVGGRNDEKAAIYSLYKEGVQIQTEFLSGNQTWGEFFQNITTFGELTYAKQEHLEDKRIKERNERKPVDVNVNVKEKSRTIIGLPCDSPWAVGSSC